MSPVSTRQDKTLDHCYTTIEGACRAAPRASLGNSDHDLLVLTSTYKQKLKTMNLFPGLSKCGHTTQCSLCRTVWIVHFRTSLIILVLVLMSTLTQLHPTLSSVKMLACLSGSLSRLE